MKKHKVEINILTLVLCEKDLLFYSFTATKARKLWTLEKQDRTKYCEFDTTD